MNLHSLKLVLAGLLLAGYSTAFAANHSVRVGGNSTFNPALITIQRGDTVTFTNIGGTHNVVADDGSFRCANGCDPMGMSGSRTTAAGTSPIALRMLDTDGYGPPGGGTNGNPSGTAWSRTITYNTPGAFGYHCEVHGGPGYGMSGSVIVAGSTPAFTIRSAVSGNWYDPAQNGHGIQFEVLSPTLMTAFWFTFDNAGNQVWIVGAGTIDGDHVVMQANRSSGGRFPPNFNSASIVNLPWGTMTFTFSSCTAGRLDWTSSDPAFSANGTMPLTRLTQVMGTSCE